MQNKPPSDSGPDNADTFFDTALDILGDYLTKNKVPPVPPDLQNNAKLAGLLEQIAEVRSVLAGLSQGNLSIPVTLHGHMGGLLKSFQGNVRHMLWMINQVADGKLVNHIDYMGDFAKSFNTMTNAIQTAKAAIEYQKELYAKLADELKIEVEAKIKAQEALKHELEHQQELASTDALTGIANRRSFLAQANLEINRCRRNNTMLCVSMMDVDHFKTINDTLGHQVGDKVLRHLAATITQNSRSYDIVARYGGDEFIILFPSTTMENAFSAMERLNKSIASSRSSCKETPYAISIGLAAFFPSQKDLTLEDIINKADKALYMAKKTGRNRIFVMRDEEESIEEELSEPANTTA
ncbi:MAG: GGDEF domain-containing protein [Syntrophorhabdaceae bacterium]|nr:GGDEF domain-containing protein [Syntrophorhabdaceae bacterium]